MKTIGMIKSDLDPHQKAFIEKKKQEIAEKKSEASHCEENGAFPPDASVCGKCSTKAAVYMNGCMTSLNCGDSKCG